MRWELLYRFGGVFMDADSICIEPIDELVTNNVTAFAGYENEQVRPGLIATGTMGFTPQHPLCRDAIQWILANDVSVERTGHRAWKSVGPGLLTRLYDANKTNYGTGFTIHPSYFFLPIHHTGLLYNGHAKVYAYQEWGSTKQNYEVMNQVDLPRMFLPPETWVSILICSYNTPRKYIKECLQSIAQQRGHFGMEVVWINDGSSEPFTAELKEEIHSFVNTTRFIRA
jgi:mannosyltransferase OCH1-like enzyme